MLNVQFDSVKCTIDLLFTYNEQLYLQCVNTLIIVKYKLHN